MSVQALTISYQAAQAASAAKRGLTIEQEPLPQTSRLAAQDLVRMLDLVQAGTSARAYRPDVCPVSVGAGQVVVPTNLWVFPNPLDMAYSLTASFGELSAPTALSQEREFDLVIAFDAEIELPFLTSSFSWAWSAMPCWDRFGADVGRPDIEVQPGLLRTSGDWLGVIRIRCVAVGYQHTLTMRFGKVGDDGGLLKITDVRPAVTATWIDAEGEEQSDILDIDLPTCADDLLEACPDGLLVRDHIYHVTSPDDLVPVIYYNTCNGSILGVRYERP